jgi:ABC-type glycerol-3-phosphate transport system substrate-binding protein
MKHAIAALGLLAGGFAFCGGTAFAGSASVAILVEPDTWYFPGDPPFPDLDGLR